MAVGWGALGEGSLGFELKEAAMKVVVTLAEMQEVEGLDWSVHRIQVSQAGAITAVSGGSRCPSSAQFR